MAKHLPIVWHIFRWPSSWKANKNNFKFIYYFSQILYRPNTIPATNLNRVLDGSYWLNIKILCYSMNNQGSFVTGVLSSASTCVQSSFSLTVSTFSHRHLSFDEKRRTLMSIGRGSSVSIIVSMCIVPTVNCTCRLEPTTTAYCSYVQSFNFRSMI